MKLYNKKELLSKLNNDLDLQDDEYRALIRNGNHELSERFCMIVSDDYSDTLREFIALGALGLQMVYGEDIDKTLPKACAYMLASLPYIASNYFIGLQNGDIALDRLCRFNTVNFLHEVREIENFESLVDNLYDSISEVVEYGFTPESSFDLSDRIDDINESKNKIMVLRKKYIR